MKDLKEFEVRIKFSLAVRSGVDTRRICESFQGIEKTMADLLPNTTFSPISVCVEATETPPAVASAA